MLTVSSLVKHFSSRGQIIRAVDGISFTVERGETLALVGESGCGKSTTGRMILRLLEPTGGAIQFEDRNVLSLRGAQLQQYRRQAQIIFQDPFSSLNPRMTVERIVGEPLIVQNVIPKGGIRSRVVELLQLVGLSAQHLDRYPHEFSGGQRQRVGIARALALEPKLIVCDEPVSSLDVSVQAQIINLLADLQQRLGIAYLFISHNLAVVRNIAHRVAVMYLGRIVELGPVEQVFLTPRHPYTQALLSAVPDPDRSLTLRARIWKDDASPSAKRERATEVHQRVALEGEPASPVNIPSGCRFHPRCPFDLSICAEEDPALLPAPTEASGIGNGVAAAACHKANAHPGYVGEADVQAETT